MLRNVTGRTAYPVCGMMSRNSSAASTLSASRTGVLLMSNAFASAPSVKVAPGGISNSTMRRRVSR